MTSIAESPPAVARTRSGSWASLAREIARGGLAGLLAGVVVIGIGGRLVMRLAALLVPGATGLPTENGNRIGTITLDGTVAIIIFVGLLGGLVAGVVWVTISPWIPGRGTGRALVAMPIAALLGGAFLVNADNPDFILLEHNPVVVAALIGLMAILGFAVAWVDDRLDGRLPSADSASTAVLFGYSVVTAIGILFLVPVVVIFFATPESTRVALALFATGAVTLAWWAVRLRGASEPPRPMLLAGRAALSVAVVLGAVLVVPEIAGALGA